MPTIIPLTSEDTWLPFIRNLPEWNPPLQPTIVLAPHPDDETLGAGGLIAKLRSKGVPVTVIAITDGEGAYADAKGLAEVRVQEQTAALGRLDVAERYIHRLKLPDRKLTENEGRLYEFVMQWMKPNSHIIAPWIKDFHPDHEAAGRVAGKIATLKNLPLTSYIFWTWHRGSPETLSGTSMVSLPLTQEEQDTKRHALAAHASQFQHPDGQPILSEELLAPARRSFEVYIRS